MAFFSFSNWLKNLRSSLEGTRRHDPRSAVRSIRRSRLNVELVEDRVVPSTLATHALIEAPTVGIAADAVTTTGAWTAVANASWLHPTAGNGSGTGNGTAIFTLDANTGATGTGTLTIAGETLTVIQAGSTYVAAYPVTLPVGGSSVKSTIAVDATGDVYFFNGSAVDEWNAATQTVSTVIPASAGLTSDPGGEFANHIAVDRAGNIFVAEAISGAYHATVVEWNAATQTLSQVVPASAGHTHAVTGLAVDISGNVYTSSLYDGVYEWNAANPNGLLLSGASLSTDGVVVDGASNVYFNTGNFGNATGEWNPSTQTISSFAPMGGGAMAGDGAGNLDSAPAGYGASNVIFQWNAATQTKITATSDTAFGNGTFGVGLDPSGNIYAATYNDGLVMIPVAFVSTGAVSETAAAGSDSLLPVLDTQPLLGQFAPTSNQTWLTITGVTGDVVSYSFTQNTGAARTANITVLGKTIAVTQSATAPPTVTTPTAASITSASALLGGDVTSAGLLVNGTVASITQRGIVYAPSATNANPTIGDTGVLQVNDPSNTTGVFTDTVSSLQIGTAYSYAAFATTSVGTSYSPVATFSTLTSVPPAMTTQPTSQAVNALSTVSFTAAASGTPAPTVQWEVNTNDGNGFNPISGATSATLSFTATGDLSGDEYEAVFTNSAGSITTNTVTLTVADAPLTAGLLSPPTGTGTPTVSTFVASNQGLDGPAFEAFDSSGNLYVANTSTNTVSKITTAGVVSIFVPSTAGLSAPFGLAFDSSGNLYVANDNSPWTISKFSSTGASLGTFASMGNDTNPVGLAFDNSGNLYVADSNAAMISKVTPNGVVSTFLSSGVNQSWGLAFDSSGNLYVGGYNAGTISKFSPTGAPLGIFASVSGLASGLAFDSSGNLYVGNVGGTTVSEFSPTGASLGTFASGLTTPIGLAFDNSGSLYIANQSISTITKVAPPPPVEGKAFSNRTVFHFTDGDPNGTVSDYTAVVKLNGSTIATLTSASSSSGQIVANSGGGFDVQLSYAFPEELTNATFSVTVTDVGGSTTGAGTSAFSVADAPLTADTIATTTQGVENLTNAAISATFTDGAGASSLPSDFTGGGGSVTIDWNTGAAGANGSPAADASLSVADVAGAATITGAHDYTAPGPYYIHIHVVDDGGSATDIYGSTTVAIVADPGYWAPVGSAVEFEDPAGTWSAAGATAPTTDLPGTYSAAGASSPTEASPGYFVADSGSSSQTPAPVGYYVPSDGATAATEADPGYYVASSGQSSETPAAPGSYVPTSGATSATPANPGYYVPGSAATSEIEDPAGTFSGVGAAVPTVDPAGTYSAPGAASPTQDPAGTYSAAGAASPTIDPDGTYSAPGASSPTPFPAGALSNLNQVYSGAPESATATISGLGTSNFTFTYDGAATPPTNVGSYAVVATLVNATYQGTVTGTLHIAQAPSATSVVDAGGVYNGTAFAATAASATGVGGLNDTTLSDFTFSYVGTGSTVYAASPNAPVNAGTYMVTATYAGDNNHTGSSGSASFTIIAEAVTIAGDVYILNKSASGALTLSGNANLNVVGRLQVDSSSATAIKLSGNAKVKAATDGGGSAADPLGQVLAPTAGADLGAINVSGNNTESISAGTYDSITVSGNGKLILGPGTYYIGTGGINISGNARVSSTGGVMLYNNGAINISGNANVNLTAESSGDYQNIAIFQARDDASAIVLSGNAVVNLHNAVFYSANVQSVTTLSGNAVLDATLIVNELNISGNSDDNT